MSTNNICFRIIFISDRFFFRFIFLSTSVNSCGGAKWKQIYVEKKIQPVCGYYLALCESVYCFLW